jgi:radical SAM protein with 4Fe4S-binding SPASM domain
MAILENAAAAKDIKITTYVATNGILTEKKARWLAHRFDLVGLSCDGTPDIQNRQRPLVGGRPGSHILERTGRILREEGCRIHIRSTITEQTLHRQAEIADYICRQFSPEKIHCEPVYAGGRSRATLSSRKAGQFAIHFLKAQKIARGYNVPLESSGSRPGSIHGSYCNVFRSVLNLVPGGVATACFKTSLADQVMAKKVKIGAINHQTGRFELNHSRIQVLRMQLDSLPPHCEECFNRYHCERGCPDFCPLDKSSGSEEGNSRHGPGFRCMVRKTIAHANMRMLAEELWNQNRIHAKGAGRRRPVCGTILVHRPGARV